MNGALAFAAVYDARRELRQIDDCMDDLTFAREKPVNPMIFEALGKGDVERVKKVAAEPEALSIQASSQSESRGMAESWRAEAEHRQEESDSDADRGLGRIETCPFQRQVPAHYPPRLWGTSGLPVAMTRTSSVSPGRC